MDEQPRTPPAGGTQNDLVVEDVLEACARYIATFRQPWQTQALIGCVERIIGSHQIPDETRALLARALTHLRAQPEGVHPLDCHGKVPTPQSELSALLLMHYRALVNTDYLFHGTVWGKLASIHDHGLVPGRAPVWKRLAHVRRHSDSAVFFTDNFSAAAGFARIAFNASPGRRNSAKRAPVVLRIIRPTSGVEPDQVAAMPGCWLIRSDVDVAGASVALASDSHLAAVWHPLKRALEERPCTEDPSWYRLA